MAKKISEDTRRQQREAKLQERHLEEVQDVVTVQKNGTGTVTSGRSILD